VSPLVIALLFAAVCAGAFAIGLRVYRSPEPAGVRRSSSRAVSGGC